MIPCQSHIHMERITNFLNVVLTASFLIVLRALSPGYSGWGVKPLIAT